MDTSDVSLSIEQLELTAGLFDPVNLLISLLADDTGSSEDDVDKVQDIVKAHELLHYFQMTGTSDGVRLFVFWKDLLMIKLNLISRAAELTKGRIEGPLIFNRQKTLMNDAEYVHILGLFIKAWHRFHYHYGDLAVPIEDLDRCHVLVPNFLYGVDHFYWEQRIEEKLPLVIIRFRDVDGQDHATVLGASHLREGSAKCVENIRRTFRNKPEEVQKQARLEIEGGLINPYYLALRLFQGALGDSPHNTLEEFMVLCDLALMCDEWVANQIVVENAPMESHEEILGILEGRDINPGCIFLNFLHALVDSSSSIRPLARGLTKDDVVAFDEAVLKAAGSQCSLAQLTSGAIRYAELGLDPNRRPSPYPNDLSHFFLEAFQKTLEFRAQVLKGGPFWEDVLCSESELDNWYHSNLPAFTIGKNIVSKVMLWDTPLGLHLLTAKQMQHITDIIVAGGQTTCPFRDQNTCDCCNEERDCCTGLSTKRAVRDLLDPKHCIKQQTQGLIMQKCGLKELRITLP